MCTTKANILVFPGICQRILRIYLISAALSHCHLSHIQVDKHTMGSKEEYKGKFERAIQPYFHHLPDEEQIFIFEKSFIFGMTHQEVRKLVDMARDLNMWEEGTLQSCWPCELPENLQGKRLRHHILDFLEEKHSNLKKSLKDYSKFSKQKLNYPEKVNFLPTDERDQVLGTCPVASEKTLCCNLQTLDSIRNCGFDCAYCSIQTFNNNNEVLVDENLNEKLARLSLAKDKLYHIGTGQSSDSLMWGNKSGTLDALLDFARQNSNVILELKSKSNNIAYLLKNDLPKNLICTWTLNPQTIIDHEEHLTASLDDRIDAAKAIRDKGGKVGFHFHPIIFYKGWEEDYRRITHKLLEEFAPEEVVLVSLGTVTYTKKVVNEIRDRNFHSKMLQMELVEAEGKLSYPDKIKIQLFKTIYESFSPWHGHVFFYLCMENRRFWDPVFGFEYESNRDFEQAMTTAYYSKLGN